MTDLTIKLTRIASRAVRKAQEENRKNSVPNVYVINGKAGMPSPQYSETPRAHARGLFSPKQSLP